VTQSPEAPDTAGLEQFGYRQELSRSLSFADLLIYGLIFMVPIAPSESSAASTTDPAGWSPWRT
jgi:hypothetical protein